ncbi:MAG: carbon-nitrogen hydrolase family protein [Alphaproteobacteria bacterium]
MVIKIALLQMTSGADIAENITRFEALAAEAAAQGAQFIATPENIFLMEESGKPRSFYMQAEHPGVKTAAEVAKKYKVWLLIGSVAVLPDNPLPEGEGIKTYNRSILFNPQGEIAAHYDKIHLFDVEVGDGQNYRESAKIIAGDRAVVATITPFLTLPPQWGGDIMLGMSICYDVRFPHLYRALAQKGAEILAVPAAFTAVTGEAHWHTLLRARAIENGCFVIAPAQCGTHPGNRKTFGHSLVVDPWGKVLADGGTEEGVVLVDIDLGDVAKARAKIPSLMHDREFE